MARKLSFNTYKSSEDLEPIEVEIGPEGSQKTFLFRPMVLGVEVLDLLAGFDGEDDLAIVGVFRDFLHKAVTEEDREPFFECLADPNMFVDVPTLIDISMSLVEEYMGAVPTKPASSSANGSAETGSGSKDESPKKRAPASKRSTRTASSK